MLGLCLCIALRMCWHSGFSGKYIVKRDYSQAKAEHNLILNTKLACKKYIRKFLCHLNPADVVNRS